jgi:hypothetical protein
LETGGEAEGPGAAFDGEIWSLKETDFWSGFLASSLEARETLDSSLKAFVLSAGICYLAGLSLGTDIDVDGALGFTNGFFTSSFFTGTASGFLISSFFGGSTGSGFLTSSFLIDGAASSFFASSFFGSGCLAGTG